MRYVVDINANTCSEQVEVEADSVEDAIREAMRHGWLSPEVLSGNEPEGETHIFDAVRRDADAMRRLGAESKTPHLGQWVRASFNVLVGGYVECCAHCGADVEVESGTYEDVFCGDPCRAAAAEDDEEEDSP
jgi:hypothetical protein